MLAKKIFFILIGSSICLSGFSQKTTSGSKRPIGVSQGVTMVKSSSNVVISDVPAYVWQHGCSPTSLGMVIGYYDSHGYPNLIEGDASTQTNQVDNAIANSKHYDDYSLPMDQNMDNPIADKSETGGAHDSNCIADFLQTSWSQKGLTYGQSRVSMKESALRNYIREQYPDVSTTARNESYNSFENRSWQDYMNEIDHNRPVVLTVDSKGDGNVDHAIIGIGYNATSEMYAAFDTWDRQTHWFHWHKIADGDAWGIHTITFVEIGYSVEASARPASGGSITGSGLYQIGQQARLIANPGTFYKFENWTADGTVVSTESVYEFIVTGKTNLVANFISTLCEIKVEVEPIDGGYVRGGGRNRIGEEITLWAMKNAGYKFVNWIENEIEVSDDSIYTFIGVGDRELRAVFEDISSIQLFENNSKIVLYPNPANDILYLNLDDAMINNIALDIEIVNSHGSIVAAKKYEKHANIPVKLNLNGIHSGLYFVRIVISGKETVVKKVLILR